MTNRKTEAALEGSIKHWQENVAAETPDDASTDASDCALCLVFQPKDGPVLDACKGCPVSAKTGELYCHGTPYYGASLACIMWKSHRGKRTKQKWRKAAQAELDFLISLRPVKDRP
jgi:hypothetical protein